jgi:hypothetical protein
VDSRWWRKRKAECRPVKPGQTQSRRIKPAEVGGWLERQKWNVKDQWDECGRIKAKQTKTNQNKVNQGESN